MLHTRLERKSHPMSWTNSRARTRKKTSLPVMSTTRYSSSTQTTYTLRFSWLNPSCNRWKLFQLESYEPGIDDVEVYSPNRSALNARITVWDRFTSPLLRPRSKTHISTFICKDGCEYTKSLNQLRRSHSANTRTTRMICADSEA